jgi:uncharacterized protein (AIM24 family)
MQFVEIKLDPGETVIAEAGGMMYMTAGIQMQTVFGDPSQQQGGFLKKAMSAGKRMLTGESLFMTTFTANLSAGRKETVAFASPYPGKIIPMHLDQMGGELICQKDAFLCAAKGVTVGIAFQKKIGAALFGGEGLFLATLTGPGKVWMQSLPFSRLAGRVLANASGVGGKDEGSILGHLGGFLGDAS